ncbi:hypothetical protein HQ531_01050 [bacterium]|nr:hypothetical protein [bacterium]
MRKPIQIFIIILFALSFVEAADLIRPKLELSSIPNGVRVSLDFRHITEAQWRNMLAHPSAFHQFGYGVSGSPGDAALPMITEVIPFLNIGDISLEAIQRQEIILAEIELKATPEGHLDSEQTAIQISDYDWSIADRFVVEEISVGEAVIMRDHQFLPVTIRPVLLDASSQSMRIPTHIEFEIHGLDLDEAVDLTQEGGVRSISLPEDQFAPKGTYLIITPPSFIIYTEYFAEWKLRQGHDVTIVTTEVTGNTANNIKAYIQGIWDAGENRPDYVVLVGDEDRGIPGHYIQSPQGEYLVTDHPYALMEGEDSFPELLVGRFSVDDNGELGSMVGKIVAYESDPYMANTDWFTRALMISTTWGAASAQATKEWIADKLYENGYDQVYTAYHPGVSSPTAISIPINTGVSFVNYRGFGMYNGWYGPDFTNSNIQSMIINGSKTPVITSVVCGGGNFAAWEDPCFGEKWTRHGSFANPKGAVAFFGPSELYTHTQFNNVIDIGIYSGIFDQGITTLGAALWNGKFELWRNYYQNSFFPFGQTPEFYHHIYNLLGDPGMQLWTAIPELLSVSHSEMLTMGDNSLSVIVNNESGEALQGAYVALYNTENALGGYTDANGEIVLPFAATAAGEVLLTITGNNLHPYLTTLPVTADEHSLVLSDWSLSGGGSLQAGNSWPMSITLFNPGAELTDIQLSFSTVTPGVSVDESVNISSIPAGSSYDVTTIFLTADADLAHGTPVTVDLNIQIAEEIWSWQKLFTVQAPSLSINSLNIFAGNLNAGDSVDVDIMLLNEGGMASGPIVITPLEHELVTFTNDDLICPDLAMDAMGSAENNLNIAFSDQVFPGEILNLRFECTLLGLTDTLEYDLQVGDLLRYGPSQKDEYGYRVFDNFDLSYTNAQAYDWIEIDPTIGGFGSLVGMSDTYEEGDASRTIDLPFPVTFYGQTYTEITICTNGWAGLGDQSVVDFHNRTIPSPIGPTAMLAPFWDDLLTNPGYVLKGTAEADEYFVIQWKRMRNLAADNDLSFQIIIFNTDHHPTNSGDNNIKFQYQTYENVDVAGNFSTTGIESPNYETGVLVSYNNVTESSVESIENHTALLFSTDRGERLPDAIASISGTNINFFQNPWSTASDSIAITNVGESPLAYNIRINSAEALAAPAPPAVFDPGINKSSPDAMLNTPATREGSDSYGHTWKKSTEEGGPEYAWQNIELAPNALAYIDDPDDSSIGPVSLGFEFPFYDDVYSEIYISSNGSASFESSSAPWLNTHLPSASAPPAFLAPWWDDLNGDVADPGTIYFWTNNHDQCIITWKDFPKWGTPNLYTFQIILNSFGKIIYQYESLEGVTTSSTVGMQNAEQNIGLMIHYNEATPFEAGLAISIRRPFEWFSASSWSGQIEPGETSYFVVNVQTADLELGHYEVPLLLSTSAANYPEGELLIGLDIVMGEPPMGDLNHDYQVNLNDLMSLFDFVLLIEEMSEEQYYLADLSADEEVNVIDVVLLIDIILDSD